MPFPPLILATRGSDLALTQTRMVAQALRSAHPGLEIEEQIVKTIGDERQDLKLSEFASGDNPVVDKGIFTKELERALHGKTAHAAVHSLKDVPTDLDPQFEIVAVLPRAPVDDLALFKPDGPSSLAALPPGSTVATSSVRRQRFLQLLHPHLKFDDIRGNVPTRLRKLRDQDFAAIILAGAGLVRLYGSDFLANDALSFEGISLPVESLDPEKFLPAASQGAVAIETLASNSEVKSLLAAINDAPTFRQITGERAFLGALSAGCDTPVGALSRFDGETLHLNVAVFNEDGSTEPLRASGHCKPGGEIELGQRLFHDLQS